MAGLTFCTIVSANYLPYARVLASSLAEHHSGAPLVVLLVDRVAGRFDPAAEPFQLIEVEELATLADPLPFLFKYTVLEANTAVKPYLLEHLLDQGAERLVYLDPDIRLYRPLERVAELLVDHSIVVTPHLTAPIDDDRHPDELAILRSGAYNLGFLALADGPTTRSFLGWWQDRVFDRCVSRVEQGLFVDQKWIDLVPGMFEGVAVLTDPGHNVAYWNLHARRISAGDPPLVNGRPLVFLHFSGVDPARPDEVSRHQDRFRLVDLGDGAELFRHYVRLLADHGLRDCADLQYAYAAFDDGTPIPEVARDLYRLLGEGRSRFGNPFAVADGFCSWLNRPWGVRPTRLTRLLHHLWSGQGHLQVAFPDPAGRDLDRFADWLRRHGATEFGLASCFLEPVLPRRQDEPGQPIRPTLRDRLWVAYTSRPARAIKGVIKGRLGELRVAELRRWWRRPAGPPGDPAEPAHRRLAALAERPPGVNVIGYLTTESGVGESARCLVRALEAGGVELSLADLELGVASRRGDTSLELGGRDHPINLLVVNADQVEVVAARLGPERFAGHLNVGFWAWEMEELPAEWRPAFRHFDELWTHSRFCLEAFTAVSPVPVRRVPLPVAVPEGVTPDRGSLGIAEDAFVVLLVFDFLSYFERKNPLALVEAFRRSLADRPDAQLVLKTANSSFAPRRLAELTAAMAGLNVQLIDETFDRQAVWRLMASCDVYASLHRAEGYGLTLLEAMALGKPVLATAYSGNTDFMSPSNSLPVGYRLAEVARDEGPYRQGQLWAEPDLDHAAELLRRVYDDRGWGRRIGETARAEVAARLSPAAVAELFRRRVAALLARLPPTGSRSLALPGGG